MTYLLFWLILHVIVLFRNDYVVYPRVELEGAYDSVTPAPNRSKPTDRYSVIGGNTILCSVCGRSGIGFVDVTEVST